MNRFNDVTTDLFLHLFRIGDYTEVDSTERGYIREISGESMNDMTVGVEYVVNSNFESGINVSRIKVISLTHTTTTGSGRNHTVIPPPPLPVQSSTQLTSNIPTNTTEDSTTTQPEIWPDDQSTSEVPIPNAIAPKAP